MGVGEGEGEMRERLQGGELNFRSESLGRQTSWATKITCDKQFGIVFGWSFLDWRLIMMDNVVGVNDMKLNWLILRGFLGKKNILLENDL